MIIHRHALLLCAALAGWSAPAARGAGPDAYVVEVYVTAQTPDASMPWRRHPPVARRGFGAVIGPGRVVTAESLVRNQVLVELRRARSGAKIAVRVAESDPQAGAAILTWDPCPALAGLEPIPLADAIPPDTEVEIVQFDDTGQIQSDRARLSEVSVAPLPEASGAILMYRALASLNTGDRGAPVVFRGRLAGLVLQSDRSSQTCRILPAAVLRRFLEDALSPPYRGLAVAGFSWAPLVDPVKRAYRDLETAPGIGGIEVLRILPGTGAGTALQPGDVILEWDGADLDAQGYYQDPEFGRLLLPFLINGRRRPGDTVTLTVWRNGESLDIPLTLSRRRDEDALVPENIGRARLDYLVDCGLVFRELGGDYLRAAGDQWLLHGNPRLVHLYLTRAQDPERPGDRVVILVGVLPDAANIGYQHLHDAVVTAVNGQPIRNLADMFAIMDRDGGLARVSLQSFGQDLVLDPAEREASNRRLAELYRIPALRYRQPNAETGK